MVFKQSPALECSVGSGEGPAARGLRERLKHELLRQESLVGEYNPHQLMRAHGWPGTLSCMMCWSAAAQTDIPLQWSLLVETCSSDTAVVWPSTSFQDRSDAVVWTLLGWGKPSSPTLSQWDLRWGEITPGVTPPSLWVSLLLALLWLVPVQGSRLKTRRRQW